MQGPRAPGALPSGGGLAGLPPVAPHLLPIARVDVIREGNGYMNWAPRLEHGCPAAGKVADDGAQGGGDCGDIPPSRTATLPIVPWGSPRARRPNST